MPAAELDIVDIEVGHKATSATATSTKATASDLSVDWGDEDAMSRDGLDRIKPTDDKAKVRCAVLTDFVKPQVAWKHYIPKDGKKGGYRCLSKRDKKKKWAFVGAPACCCQKLNGNNDTQATLEFAVLCLKYINADVTTGGYKPDANGDIPPIRWEIGWLKLSRAGFKAISELVLEGETAEDFDFTISVKENTIGYDYKRKSKGLPLFRTNPELLAEVKAEAAQYADGIALQKNLGRLITEIDMKALLAGASVATGGKGNIDDTGDL